MPIDFIIIESYKLRFEGTRSFLVFFPTSAGILIVTICKDANVSFLRICWEAGIWLQFLGLCFPSVASLNKPWVGDLGGQTMVETPTCGLLLKRREPRSIQLWFPAQSSKVMQPINAARTGLRERERMEESCNFPKETKRCPCSVKMEIQVFVLTPNNEVPTTSFFLCIPISQLNPPAYFHMPKSMAK